MMTEGLNSSAQSPGPPLWRTCVTSWHFVWQRQGSPYRVQQQGQLPGLPKSLGTSGNPCLSPTPTRSRGVFSVLKRNEVHHMRFSVVHCWFILPDRGSRSAISASAAPCAGFKKAPNTNAKGTWFFQCLACLLQCVSQKCQCHKVF